MFKVTTPDIFICLFSHLEKIIKFNASRTWLWAPAEPQTSMMSRSVAGKKPMDFYHQRSVVKGKTQFVL
jgi:hypothetical protein